MNTEVSIKFNQEELTLLNIAELIVQDNYELMKKVSSEEDLKIGFESLLTKYLLQIGIKLDPKYEKSIFKIGKRTDALHGHIIIEYEKPHSFKRDSVIKHAFNQLVEYIIGEAIANNETLFLFEPKYIGVGFDGEQIFFVRYKGDKTSFKEVFSDEDFALIGPYIFERESAITLLTFFRALTKFLLTPENLAEKFGPKSKTAPLVVSALIDAFHNWRNSKIEIYYNEWKRLFGIVYGEQFTNETANDVSQLTNFYGITKEVDFQELLFCIHTYFAILMKLIAVDLLTLKESTLLSSYSQKILHLRSDELEKQFEDIEKGGIYAKRGITNFLEGDFFCWYLNSLSSPRLEEAIRDIIRVLSDFEPATSIITPEATKDLLKKLYQYLVPKEIRHRLGEYYTPDWLAELTIDEIGYEGNTLERVLDPACGSGTFLVLAIQKAKEFAIKNNERKKETVKRIINNIWGFDLNPLAVIASRTNYLFALGNLVNDITQLELPVYLADSILWPEQTSGQLEISPQFGKHISIQTSVGIFHIPHFWIKDNGLLMQIAAPIISELVSNEINSEIALEHLRKVGCVIPEHKKIVEHFYNQLLDLEKNGKNGIWARFLKNAFAPMMSGKFDYVIGNPPWIRWDYLSTEYRIATRKLWENYGLFSLKGFETRLGGGKKDFSMLFVYACSDYFLKDGAKLGFLITQEVFKSKGAGEGFRKFSIGNGYDEKIKLQVIKAHDLVALQPFEGAANKTAAIFLKKGKTTKYPVKYYIWSKNKGVGKINPEKSYKKVLELIKKEKYLATPIGSEVGSWQTEITINSKLKISGENNYSAHSGAYISPYGVFWLKINEVLSDKKILISNITDKGKIKINTIIATIESDLIYPGLRGKDIKRWGCDIKINVLLTQNPEKREPYSENIMKRRWPRTYNYLVNFKEILNQRASKVIKNLAEKTTFYAVFGVGEYTMSKYKVVWKRMTNDLIACVVSQHKTPFGWKTVIPFETTSMIATDNKNEAHYLCSIINSKPVRDFVKSFSSAGRGFGTPSIMKYIAIPKFDIKNPNHKALTELSQRLHELKTKDFSDYEIKELEDKVDEYSTNLFK